MKQTAEQEAIVDAMGRGVACIKVEAGAGTGKTSTIVAGARAQPRKRGILTVFNRLMAEETKPRLAQTRCTATTMHAIAYRSGVADPYKSRLSMRLPARMAAASAGLSGPIVHSGVDLGVVALGYLLMDWVSRFCQSAETDLGARHFPRSTLKAHLGAELSKEADSNPAWFRALSETWAAQLLPAATVLWRRLSDPVAADFPSTHDVYLKLYMMSGPKIDADYVMLDEAQDANPIMLQFMQLAARQGAQTVYVGDSHQQLYAWRGAVDAMRSVHADAALQLTHSFRFGPDIAEVANAVLGAMIGSDFRLVGAGGPSVIAKQMDAPTAVICRGNAASITTALDLEDAGRKCGLCMEPREIENEILTLERFSDRGTSDDRRYCHFGSYGELQESVASGSIPELKVLMGVIDEHGFSGARTLLSRLAVGKSAESIARAKVDTMLLTGHASKGLEFDRVLLGSDFKPVMATDERQARSDEMNILYVAVTRAKRELCLGESEAADEIRTAMGGELS